MLGFLPSDLNIDDYMKSVSSALIMNPDIFLECTAESIKRSCIKAANDGLRLDNKESALVKYWNKDAVNPKTGAKGVNEAQYMVMVFGIRKKARKHDGIIIKAIAVHKNDSFIQYEGDDGRIEHMPAGLEDDPGPVIGSYAIFMKEDQTILHREVMRLVDIKAVQNASKSPNSPAWRNWFGEMAKKAAVNRGAKSVPMSEAVRQVIDRDNDFFDLQANRDQPQERAAVSLDRFSGGRRSEGFTSGNVGRQLADQSGQGMQMDAGKQGDKEAATQGRSDGQQGGKQQQAKEIDGSANYPTLPRKTVEEYATTLNRYATPDNVLKGHEEFWKESGKPTETADVDLVKFILDRQIKRADGKMEIAQAKSEINEEIAKAYKL
jgi:recombinational DNA repair protein RecT